MREGRLTSIGGRRAMESLIAQAQSIAGDQIHTVQNWIHAYRYAGIAKNEVAERTSKRCLEWFVNRRKRREPITRGDCSFIANVFLMQEKAKEADIGVLR
jgi:hypothetical protein